MKFCRLNHLNLPQNIDIRGDKNFYGSRKYYFTNQSFHSGRNGDFVALHVLLTRWQRKAIPKIHDLSLLMGFSLIDNKSSGPQFLEAKPYFSQYFYLYFFSRHLSKVSQRAQEKDVLKNPFERFSSMELFDCIAWGKKKFDYPKLRIIFHP